MDFFRIVATNPRQRSVHGPSTQVLDWSVPRPLMACLVAEIGIGHFRHKIGGNAFKKASERFLVDAVLRQSPQQQIQSRHEVGSSVGRIHLCDLYVVVTPISLLLPKSVVERLLTTRGNGTAIVHYQRCNRPKLLMPNCHGKTARLYLIKHLACSRDSQNP